MIAHGGWSATFGNDRDLGELPFFELRECTGSRRKNPCLDDDGHTLPNGFHLAWTADGAQAVNELLLDAPEFAAGDAFGVASVNLRTVPEPSSVLLVGIGLVWLARRREAAGSR